MYWARDRENSHLLDVLTSLYIAITEQLLPFALSCSAQENEIHISFKDVACRMVTSQRELSGVSSGTDSLFD